jgi:hypothetical protein
MNKPKPIATSVRYAVAFDYLGGTDLVFVTMGRSSKAVSRAMKRDELLAVFSAKLTRRFPTRRAIEVHSFLETK